VTRRVRIGIFAAAGLALGGLLGWSVAGLPDFGHYRGPYGYLLNRVVVPERHTTNVVAAIVFDVRGLDTMGEEFILFAAVMGVVLLLRGAPRRAEAQEAVEWVGSDALRIVAALMVGAGVLVGLWLIAFGYVTPGGGFQGGVVVASGAALLYFAFTMRSYRPFANEQLLDPLEATGAGGFVVVGLAAVVAGSPFLHNLLGPGTTGTLKSGGSIALLNWCTGLEVAAALLTLYSEFLQEYVVPLARGAS
jgi:multicomponent Na+:H+ antiporter subunit B